MNFDADIMMLVFRLPTFLVYLCGCIYAFIQWGKNPRIAILMGAASFLYVVVSLISILATHYYSFIEHWGGGASFWIQIVVSGVGEAICLALVVTAVFLRKPS